MTEKETQMTEKDLLVQRKLDALKKEWESMPHPAPIIETGRKHIPIYLQTTASAFDFEEKHGNTVYEVVGHFDPDANENLLQKILRQLREENNSHLS